MNWRKTGDNWQYCHYLQTTFMFSQTCSIFPDKITSLGKHLPVRKEQCKYIIIPETWVFLNHSSISKVPVLVPIQKPVTNLKPFYGLQLYERQIKILVVCSRKALYSHNSFINVCYIHDQNEPLNVLIYHSVINLK